MPKLKPKEKPQQKTTPSDPFVPDHLKSYPRILSNFSVFVVALTPEKHSLILQGNRSYPDKVELNKDDYEIIIEACQRHVESLKLHALLVNRQTNPNPGDLP